jgi:hypothetical protein
VVGDNTPTVEGAQIIKDTVRAAANVDWPSECFRIIDLDDEADPELKTATRGWVLPTLERYTVRE